MTFLAILHRVVDRASLSAEEAEQAMALILSGQATTAQIAAFLVALRMKGETPDEVLGFARAMRARAARVDGGPPPLLDTCGTGGDNAGTFNISTVVALVVAGAGVRVAKHGNRSISSRCGSADVLEGLGVRIDLSPEAAGRSIREVGIGFLFAPALHPAMKYAQPARVELKMRSVFNLLGPLANPAGATAQLAGAPSLPAAELMARALAALGLERGFVVHGSDGLDENTTTGQTQAFEISQGEVTPRTLAPEDFGVARARAEDLAGGDRDENSRIARAILDGETGPRRDIVLVNAAAALVAAGRAAGFEEGVALAARSIDSGAAGARLEHLAAFTHSVGL
ncbi:MAG: anthranilate phosphoribosyltransferase [Acidobacteria bacterium]|nr:anthranilate phosphoribosyltransferase [Acidobacteriota bacterium]